MEQQRDEQHQYGVLVQIGAHEFKTVWYESAEAAYWARLEEAGAY